MTTLTKAPVVIKAYVGEEGESCRIATLALDELEIPFFQRERKSHLKKIAAAFDRTAYIFPIVICFEGRYIVIDGQQRIGALETLGESEATLLVIEGVETIARASQLYLLINRDRKNLDAFEKFVGAAAAEDPGTLAIQRICAETEMRCHKSAAGSNCLPTGAVTSIHANRGGDVLSRVLMVRALAWGYENPRESREAMTLRGLAAFIGNNFEKIDDNQLVEILRKTHPASLLDRASDRRNGPATDARYADHLRDLWNKTPRKGRPRL